MTISPTLITSVFVVTDCPVVLLFALTVTVCSPLDTPVNWCPEIPVPKYNTLATSYLHATYIMVAC